MPSSIVKSFAKKTGKDMDEVERLWKKARALATNAKSTSDKDYYPYVVGILRRMLKMSEDTRDSDAALDKFLESASDDSEDGEVSERTPGARYRIKKQVRGGKVVRRKVNVGRAKRLTPKQKAALKKARRYTNRSAAKRKRARSSKIRKSRGL